MNRLQAAVDGIRSVFCPNCGPSAPIYYRAVSDSHVCVKCFCVVSSRLEWLLGPRPVLGPVRDWPPAWVTWGRS